VTRKLDPLAEAMEGLARRRPSVTETMTAVLDLGERLFMEGRETDALLILGAIQSLQGEVIELTSALEIASMVAETERTRLQNQMGEVMQAKYEMGHAHVPWQTYVDLQGVANEWTRKKAKEATTNQKNASHKRLRTKHANKRAGVDGFVRRYIQSHAIENPQAWARQVLDGEAKTTVNALASRFSDTLITEGFPLEQQPDLKTLRNWISEHLEGLLIISGISDR
jgi:hypothetical protein